jgi:hypothetical protein
VAIWSKYLSLLLSEIGLTLHGMSRKKVTGVVVKLLIP